MLFSIIIPTFNRSNIITIAINSVINQTFSDWELIVVDDGSTDNTKEIVESYKNPKIKYIYQKNSERSAARNNGLNNANGEWICFLDSDDYILPNYLQNLRAELNTFSTDCFLVGHIKTGESLNEEIKTKSLPQLDYLVDYCLENNETIPTCSVIARRTVYENNKFDERLNNWEDTYLFLIILSKYQYTSLNLYGYVWVFHEESGNFIIENKVNLPFIKKYILTINDLFLNHGSELKIRGHKFSLKKQHIRMKLKMFFYRAYLQNEVKLMFSILIMHFDNKIYATDFTYYLKSLIKIIYKLRKT